MQHGLGKGLGALLGESTGLDPLRKPVGYINKETVTPDNAPEGSPDVLRIPSGLIDPNPYQPRVTFDREELAELADSIRTFGLIQPITVRKTGDGRYQIISGERRFRAARMIGMDLIPAYVRNSDDQGMLEMAIVENIQRSDLDPIEISMSYQRLMEECSLTQEQLASRVGKKRASVANYLRLLKLPAKVQHDIKVGLVSVGHAKVLLGVDEPAVQEQLCDAIIKNGLSVRQLEDRVRALYAEPRRTFEQDLPDFYYRILENVGKIFGDNISLKRGGNGKGTLTIRFNSDEEMERFLKALDDKTEEDA
ncbi:MAG: ParB/RepB/Spo0J family partition protein [Bacteroidales bacterium]|nr:ParB/RepB/Spo0J family partition protein [Bacteroidales bacterium]